MSGRQGALHEVQVRQQTASPWVQAERSIIAHVEVMAMTYRQLVEYLRASSERCRTHANNASDAEAAQALREVADELENAVLALEDADAAREQPAAIGAL